MGLPSLGEKLETIDYDVMVVFTPHWQTYVGTHFLGVPRFSSKSVDPVFPNIFRYNYDLRWMLISQRRCARLLPMQD